MRSVRTSGTSDESARDQRRAFGSSKHLLLTSVYSSRWICDRSSAGQYLIAIGILPARGGPDVYLIDLIPLIEMIWADGKAQEAELEYFDEYLRGHVDRINEMAHTTLISEDHARRFVAGFLEERPDAELMKALRALVAPVRLATSDSDHNSALRESLLNACLDIGARAVVEYPFKMGERFNAQEKRSYFEILESLA